MHTPGPWQVVPKGQAQSDWIVGDSEGGSVADCEPPGPWMSPLEADANARLIAVAPDMLALLKMIVASYWGYIPDFVEAANSVIDKAEDRQLAK